MRILLIGGIVFVHVPFNPDTSPFLGQNGLFDWLRVFFGDSLFRIGVPCLSAISGYLLFRRGWQGFDYGKVLKSKAKTVLLPFLLWNLGLLAVVLVVQRADMGIGYFPDVWNATAREVVTYAIALEGFPIDIPLYFLRDLLVCIVLSPVLAFLVRRFPVPVLAVLFVVASMPALTLVIILKKTILFSFTFGIFLALNRVDLRSFDRFALPGTVLTLVAAVALSIGLYWTGPEFPWPLDMARNALSMLGAGGFWLMSSMLIRTAAGRRLANTGSLSFWIFCAHYPLLVVMWMVWNKVSGGAPYPIFYVTAIVATLTIMVVSNAIVSRSMPAIYEILTGSRGRKAKLAQASRPFSATGLAAAAKPAMTQQKR